MSLSLPESDKQAVFNLLSLTKHIFLTAFYCYRNLILASGASNMFQVDFSWKNPTLIFSVEYTTIR